MKTKIDLPKEIKLHFKDDYQELLKVTPSYYNLESQANTLLDLINQWKIEDPEVRNILYPLKRKIELFRVDLPSNLKGDLKKGNKRYYDKWVILKDNLDGMKESLLALWDEHHKL